MVTRATAEADDLCLILATSLLLLSWLHVRLTVSSNVSCAGRTLNVIEVVAATIGRGVVPPRVPDFVTREDVEMHNVFFLNSMLGPRREL